MGLAHTHLNTSHNFWPHVFLVSEIESVFSAYSSVVLILEIITVCSFWCRKYHITKWFSFAFKSWTVVLIVCFLPCICEYNYCKTVLWLFKCTVWLHEDSYTYIHCHIYIYITSVLVTCVFFNHLLSVDFLNGSIETYTYIYTDEFWCE